MKVAVKTLDNKKVGDLDLSEDVFGLEPRADILHRMVNWQLAKRRSGNHKTKDVSEISGTGKKPFSQKGTGRARVGSIRSPIWVGGGKVFPATPDQNYEHKVNRKMYQGAICAILSELIRQNRLVVVESLVLEAPKTKQLVATLKGMDLADVLIVTDAVDDALALAASNLYHVGLMESHQIDPVSLVGFEKVLMTVPALKKIEEMLG